MPIHDAHGDVIGVAQAINKLSIVDEPFDEKDEKVSGHFLSTGQTTSPVAYLL